MNQAADAMNIPPIAYLRAHVFRWKVAVPVQTSFGTMHDRPMLLIEVRDSDGAIGWGEVWCNFPTVGAEHRAHLVETVFAPMLEGQVIHHPAATFADISSRTAVLGLQSGEPGPLAQCIAGIDIALWDLRARHEGVALWRLLGGTSPRLEAYASGLNPDRPEILATTKAEAGYRAFKLKVGFGRGRDRGNVRALRAGLGKDARLMVDANQAFNSLEALALAADIAPSGVDWFEEPLRADAPWVEWRRLAAECPIPLAGGENIAGHKAFDDAIESQALKVMQPDMAKWGGFSGCLSVAKRIRAGGIRYCPHFLGGGVGLLASAHLLAAAGGGGMLEVDANENPLRSTVAPQFDKLDQGFTTLTDEPGLGVAPHLGELRRLAGG